MRVLFVAPYTPSGIRVRAFQLVRHLAKAGHRLTLVALDDGSGDAAARAELESVCDAVHLVPLPRAAAALRCLAALPTPTPLWVAYCRSPELMRRVASVAAGGAFDVAHVEHLRAAFVRAALGEIPSVIDAVDCIADLQDQLRRRGSVLERLLATEEWLKLRRWERSAYAPFDRLAVTSAADMIALGALGGAALPPEAIVPNGVDLEYFTPPPAALREPETLIFSGKMGYRPNDDAACFLMDEVLPRLRARRPGVRLILAGSDPSAGLHRRAAARGGVEVTGRVDDLRPFLARASVSVCPMRIGVGIQNKALEAMAMGLPVVCTPRVALPLQPAVDAGAVLVADTADQIAASCGELLAGSERTQERGRAARRYVLERHRWDRAAAAFEELYEAAARQRRQPGAAGNP